MGSVFILISLRPGIFESEFDGLMGVVEKSGFFCRGGTYLELNNPFFPRVRHLPGVLCLTPSNSD